MAPEPRFVDVAVSGGSLRVARFGAGDRVVLAIHGITGSSLAWRAVARRLPPGWSLVAPDLRGRGGSAHLPGPYGLDRHAEDVLEVAGRLAPDGAVLTGHSMGAYVAVLAAAREPARFSRVILVDGGIPLPRDPGADPDRVLEDTLGPAIARLSRTFASEEAYADFWRAHPALAGRWTDDLDAYFRYDLTGPAGALRSRVSEAATRVDGRELLTEGERIGAALEAMAAPTVLLRAPRGLLDQPVGLIPAGVAERWAGRVAGLRDEPVTGTNHYTILLGEPGAGVVAARLAGG